MEIVKGRIPPHNIEAEQLVLGCMLVDEDAVAEVCSIIKSKDYYRAEHKSIHEAIEILAYSGKTADIITVSDALTKEGSLEKVGGLSYLNSLSSSVISVSSAKNYARIIEEKAILRELIKSSSEVVENAYKNQEDAAQVLDFAQQSVFDLVKDKDERGISHVRDILPAAIDEITRKFQYPNENGGLMTHFSELDRITSGLQKSDFILIAARPAMGKSALAVNIGQNIAIKEKKAVALFSLEMSREQLLTRILATETSINNAKLRDGSIQVEDIEKIALLSSRISEADLYIDDTAGISVASIRSKCRRLKMQNKLDLVIIDYLQLISGSGKPDNRQQEISEISRSLKIMAKDLHIPIIALSQLSRAPELRQNKRPILSDLRESGAIEQDADIVMFLYREDYYEKETERPGVAELIIAKHRNGELGTIELKWFGEYTRFNNLAK